MKGYDLRYQFYFLVQILMPCMILLLPRLYIKMSEICVYPRWFCANLRSNFGCANIWCTTNCEKSWIFATARHNVHFWAL